jgi:uncharacterized Zn finger protein (UPF0148 family)
MKVCELCGDEIFTKDGENRCPTCEVHDDPKPKEKKRRRNNRKAMDELMDSLGLVKVRGALGGVYYE